MRISDWSSDVCSSDLHERPLDAETPQIDLRGAIAVVRARRSAERRVGKECVSTCRSRWSPYHYTKNLSIMTTLPARTNTRTQTHDATRPFNSYINLYQRTTNRIITTLYFYYTP